MNQDGNDNALRDRLTALAANWERRVNDLTKHAHRLSAVGGELAAMRRGVRADELGAAAAELRAVLASCPPAGAMEAAEPPGPALRLVRMLRRV